MSIFKSEYTLRINFEKDIVLKQFYKYFDNMNNKGYSNSTIILNSDHGSKLFSGVEDDGVYKIRQIDSGGDILYRFSPLHKVRFSQEGNATIVSVKSSNTAMFLMFIIILLILIPFFCLFLYNIVVSQIISFAVSCALVIVPLAVLVLCCIISKKQFDDTKTTLIYIFKKLSL